MTHSYFLKFLAIQGISVPDKVKTPHADNKSARNKFLPVLLVLFWIISLSTLYGQSPEQVQKIRAELELYPEVYLSISAQSFTPKLAGIASLDYFENNRAYLYVSNEGFEYLIAQELAFRPEMSPGTVDFDLNMLDVAELLQKDLTDSWDFYPTYEAYVALMYQFEADYPELVKIHNIGESVMGRDLLFAQIGPDVQTERAVPATMYTSTMHGDETTGFVLSLRLIHHLITNYGVDEEITSLLEQVEVWICPNENPDGTYTNNNATVSGATRSNANGKDLNRNYPSPHPGYPNPPVMPIQPETQAMIDFADEMNFTLSANMHGGIELVNYPWDSWLSSQQLHADHNWWEFVMHEFVDTVHTYSAAGYMTGEGNGVTHGGDWYVAYGTRQDYFNYFHGCREFTLELSNQKLLSPSLLPAHWEYNHRSLINYIRQATYGIQGMVQDAQTLAPVSATIHLDGHDILNSEVSTSMPLGNFSRPVLAGSYDVVFTADGYPSVTMENITVNNYQKIDLTIFLGENVHPLYVYSSSIEGGTVHGAGIYPQGHEVLVQADPAYGFEFLYWENEQGDIVGEEAEFVYTIAQDNDVYYAVFESIPTEFAIHFATGEGEGSVAARIDNNWIPSGYVAEAGSDVEFIATPQTGYEVNAWKVNGEIIPDFTSQEYLVEDLQTVINLKTHFALIPYLLDVVVETPGSGQVYISPDNETYHYGQTVSLTAAPANGYEFQSWIDIATGEVLSVYGSYTFSMPAHDMDIKAVFEPFTGISDLEPNQPVRVFPNPARNQLTVEADFPVERIELTDESGKIIKVSQNADEKRIQISLSAVVPGFYLLRVYGAETPVVKKIQVF